MGLVVSLTESYRNKVFIRSESRGIILVVVQGPHVSEFPVSSQPFTAVSIILSTLCSSEC